MEVKEKNPWAKIPPGKKAIPVFTDPKIQRRFLWAIDEPFEAVPLSPRRMDCLRLKQLVFRMLLQPLISGLLLSWEFLPLR